MKRIVISVTLLSLVVLGMIGQAQIPVKPIPITLSTDEARARAVAEAFVAKLFPCIRNPDILRTYPECTLPADSYCLYYEEDPDYLGVGRAFHSFGWYSESLRCGALYETVQGVRYDPCTLLPSYSAPYSVLPPDPAWAIVIPTHFGKVGFWLNSPYNPKGHYIYTGGHYFTCQNRNWDEIRHCFIFEFSFTPGDCPCVCGNYGCKCDPRPSTPGTVPFSVLYVLVWEDWCGLEEWTSDWNDFVVGLIPSNIKVGPDLH